MDWNFKKINVNFIAFVESRNKRFGYIRWVVMFFHLKITKIMKIKKIVVRLYLMEKLPKY